MSFAEYLKRIHVGKMYLCFGWRQWGFVPGTLQKVGSVKARWVGMCYYREGIDPGQNMPDGRGNMSLETVGLPRMIRISAADGDCDSDRSYNMPGTTPFYGPRR